MIGRRSIAGMMLCIASVAMAQCCPPPLYGTVADPSGAPIAGAKITLNCEQGGPIKAKTDGDGKFATRHMPYGPCNVEITAHGFQAFHTKVVGSATESPAPIK